MRALFVAALCAVSLSACTPSELGSIPTSPAQISQRTIVDEQAVVSVHLAYKTFRLAAEVAVDAGIVKGALAKRLADVDNKAYSAVVLVDKAYATGNASDLQVALANANALITNASNSIPTKE